MIRAQTDWIVRKRDGRLVPFDPAFIQKAIGRAFRAEKDLEPNHPIGPENESEIDRLTDRSCRLPGRARRRSDDRSASLRQPIKPRVEAECVTRNSRFPLAATESCIYNSCMETPRLDIAEVKEKACHVADECIGVRVRILNRYVTRIYEDKLRPYGAKISQMNILVALSAKGELQPSELCRMLTIEKSTMSRNLKIMEEKGWIETSRAATGNAHVVRVAQGGRELLAATYHLWQEGQAKLEETLGEDVVKALHKAVKRVRAALDDES